MDAAGGMRPLFVIGTHPSKFRDFSLLASFSWLVNLLIEI